MRVLILGGDGYLGWATALRFSKQGHDVALVDNFLRRRMHLERGTDSLTPIHRLQERLEAWKEVTGKTITAFIGDLQEWEFTSRVIKEFRPEAIVHYGEIPSAPYSMIDVHHAVQVHQNNVNGTLHVLFAMRDYVPDCHLIKLGTMGEYGTPNIDIEEGWIEVEHNGRKDTVPFPKQPGSFYHLTKVHDSDNIIFACKIWGLKATDLNQGVVYGIDTPETVLDERLINRFDYDECFGTYLNRFVVQAVAGIPLTVYGKGGQTRGMLDIRDTLACVELAMMNPPKGGRMRVFNQLTETFSVMDVATLVQAQGAKLGLNVQIAHYENPRWELENHYYNPKHSKLIELGLQPHFLANTLVDSMIERVIQYQDRIIKDEIVPRIRWGSGDAETKVTIREYEPATEPIPASD
ncbi:MAG: NAD-dependent epimerase/dehydratase family protein [Anaerolineae bacterium]|nr:MAG: NAD-dependent epimerase/dehydratase family protein [Anaerolineae bacterium]